MLTLWTRVFSVPSEEPTLGLRGHARTRGYHPLSPGWPVHRWASQEDTPGKQSSTKNCPDCGCCPPLHAQAWRAGRRVSYWLITSLQCILSSSCIDRTRWHPSAILGPLRRARTHCSLFSYKPVAVVCDGLSIFSALWKWSLVSLGTICLESAFLLTNDMVTGVALLPSGGRWGGWTLRFVLFQYQSVAPLWLGLHGHGAHGPFQNSVVHKLQIDVRYFPQTRICLMCPPTPLNSMFWWGHEPCLFDSLLYLL